ncbi:kappa-carrageenase [Novipirellula caenicola]|uniref:GH16 domain-containing protein n=1 Tax=Novipirellula caenicola TaxID=1536901 RepID=A0ABP9VXZ7_9BACT
MFKFRNRTLAIAVVAIAISLSAQADPPQPFGDVLNSSVGDWELMPGFSDEFNGQRIDTRKWNIDTEDWGTWSWDPENVRVEDGSLLLQMVQETHQRDKQKLDYKSGIARTHHTITYGYFEARIKGCARFPGASPAFWLHSKGPQNRYRAKDGETVTYSEIDVVELQQSEFDNKTKKHHGVHHIDCNLHTQLLRNAQKQWIRPNTNPEMCKNEFIAPWDPRDDFHVYAVENSEQWIVWYIDGKEIGRKPNLYWHLPMHVTLSLGLRYPFEGYKDGNRVPVYEKTTTDGFPTAMSVDYVRVWQNVAAKQSESKLRQSQQQTAGVDKASSTTKPIKPTLQTNMTKAEFVAMEKEKWNRAGWAWDQAKVESNFDEMDTNHDGITSGIERQRWFAKKKESANQ